MYICREKSLLARDIQYRSFFSTICTIYILILARDVRQVFMRGLIRRFYVCDLAFNVCGRWLFLLGDPGVSAISAGGALKDSSHHNVSSDFGPH